MNTLIGTFEWAWNCGSKNDIDVSYYWGDNGILTIQRQYLRKIIYKWRFCNTIDGWFEETKIFELPQPTSEPYTFPVNVSFVKNLGVNKAHLYWGKKYKVETILYVISGEKEIIDEEYPNTIKGCFIKGDIHFNPNLQPGCIPPDILCEDTNTVCD